MESFTLLKLIYPKHTQKNHTGRGKQVGLLKMHMESWHENTGAKSEKPRYVMTYKKSRISLYNEKHYYIITWWGTKKSNNSFYTYINSTGKTKASTGLLIRRTKRLSVNDWVKAEVHNAIFCFCSSSLKRSAGIMWQTEFICATKKQDPRLEQKKVG